MGHVAKALKTCIFMGIFFFLHDLPQPQFSHPKRRTMISLPWIAVTAEIPCSYHLEGIAA